MLHSVAAVCGPEVETCGSQWTRVQWSMYHSVARDVLLHARGGCAAYVDCLVREHVSREGWNSLQIKLEPI